MALGLFANNLRKLMKIHIYIYLGVWIIGAAFFASDLHAGSANEARALPFVNISCAPRKVNANEWSVLVITQIFTGETEDTVSLNEKSLEVKALFGKKVDIVSPVDELDKYKLRVQVYMIKALNEELHINKSDFINSRGIIGPQLEFHIQKNE